MTREEMIEIAALRIYPDDQAARLVFMAGAMFADSHPINVWHDASEEPQQGRLMLGIEGDDASIYKWVGQDPQGWIPFTKDMCLSKWAYIADLLPKGGE